MVVNTRKFKLMMDLIMVCFHSHSVVVVAVLLLPFLDPLYCSHDASVGKDPAFVIDSKAKDQFCGEVQ